MAQTLDQIRKETDSRMAKTVETLKTDLGKMRTGRASPTLLENIRVDYYGNKSPLSQVANVGVGDARTITVQPWDKGLIAAIEKAIRESDLGLNPVTAGGMIRVPLPPLTEERRKELTKHVRAEGENAKVAIRNIRRDANQHVKELLKKKLITEDEDKRAETEVQKATDKYIVEVDKVVAAKEKDIMQV
jgi:ribosome recycling factor